MGGTTFRRVGTSQLLDRRMHSEVKYGNTPWTNKARSAAWTTKLVRLIYMDLFDSEAPTEWVFTLIYAYELKL